MKKTWFALCTFALLLITTWAFAQAPQSFSYQAVVRNGSGQIAANQQVSLRLTITDAANGGNILYRESHTAATNQFGLVNVAVGNGTALNGVFNNIAWGSGSRYLQVEVDPAGGNTFTDLGTTQLLSVPYALYAQTSGNGGGATGATGATGDTGAQGIKGDTGAQGIKGDTGAQGIKGDTGAKGTTGATGATGATGNTGQAGDRYTTTSTTSLAISTGAKTLTVGTGLSYAVGQTVIIANNATNIMTGTVTAYNSVTGVMSVNVTSISGSGTFAVWTVALNGAPGPAGPTGVGVQGVTGATGAKGDTGATGATGVTGQNGTNGATGATGATGTFGATGTTGQTIRHNGTTWVANSTLYNDGTNVGIGTTALPAESKLVVGASNSTNEGGQIQLNAPGGSYTTAHFIDNYENKLRIMTGTNSGSSTTRLSIDNSGNVGIGTVNPTKKLHVVGEVRIADGTEGAGKVLTSDANGNATWKKGGTAFKAKMTNGVSVPNTSTYSFKPSDVVFNDDNNYNAGTGEFIVPESGTYHFELVVNMKGSTSIPGIIAIGNILVNGTTESSHSNVIETNGNTFTSGIAFSTNIRLNAADKVSVSTFTIWTAPGTLSFSGSSYFSGFKLQ